MKKNIFIFIIFICVGLSSIHGQSILNKDMAFNYEDFPQEKIFVHFNSTFLVSGESLFYKIYCLNANTNAISKLSKIAYVELINTDKNTVLKHKIALKSGLGKGDFFIKASIPSGNYKIIAYTQWMRNNGENTFFQNDVTIINPFRTNKKLTVKTDKNQDTIMVNNDVRDNNIKVLNHPIKNEFVEIVTNKKTFLKREKVVLTLKPLKGKFSLGNYSVSVRKIDAVNAPSKRSSNSFINQNHLKIASKDSIFFLPELRGALLSGTMFSKKNNAPIPHAKVSLTIPGEHAIFKIATTNSSGEFYFNLDETYKNTNAIVQVIGSNKDVYKVEINNYESPSYNNFVFNDFKLTPKLTDLILNKSIFNQIENAYHSVKRDSILPIDFKTPSYRYKEKKYILSDYTRFKTLKETITEVVDAVYVLQENGDYTFHIKFYNDTNKSDASALVLIDGILIQNHNSVTDFNANSIKSIGVVRDKYVYGGQLFNGIISIETLKGDYNPTIKGDYINRFEIDKPIVNKKYFKLDYSDSELNRIPDFRNQLLWHPNLNLISDENQISFYTSDIAGDYEISFEGFTNLGKPVTIKTHITVKNN
ncbi:hypothetical protein [Hwangdonia lutea]|uniref:Macroglobulin domain-containing protein n=1 Tax=Hwangdonia lutea TaxID=3075823 RepID=A0AA97HR39_9FLAO|nr:hypothetical protein [Hwangdonia sp. SCSIO 19198]WOD43023.1 hypothetical protein RNZ46_13605 [Hwangdonia sp. SCSIO 19198]